MDFHEYFNEIGDFGRYQKFILWFVLLPAQLPYECHMYYQFFMSIIPDHWCRVTLLDHLNVTVQFNRNLFIPKKGSVIYSLEYEQCLAYDVTYEELTIHSSNIGWIPNQTWPKQQCQQWVYNRTGLGQDQNIITMWNLVCDRSFMPTLALMVFFSGIFLGEIIFVFSSNIFGKRKTYFIILTFQCLFGILTAFSDTFETFCILRFGVGLTMPAILSVPRTLSMELTPLYKRSHVIVLSELFRSISALLLLIVSFQIRDFRHVTIAISVPFILFIFYWWVLPESLRYLICHERIEDADRLIRAIALTNGRFIPPDFSISLRCHYFYTLKRRIRIECAIRNEMDESENRPQLIKLFILSNMRRKLSILCGLWLSNITTNIGLTYYLSELSDNGNSDIYTLFLINIMVNTLGMLISQLTLKRFGRKCTIGISNILSGVFSIMSAFARNRDKRLCLLYFASAKLSLSCSSGAMSIWLFELIPDSVNSAAINLCDIIGHLGPVTVPLLIYYGKRIDTITLGNITLNLSVILAIFGILPFVSGLLALTLPETSEQNCPKNMNDADVFGKYWSWSDCFKFQPLKKEPINGILKNKGPQPQSPILSLIRKQESLRRNDFDAHSNNQINEINESPNKICTIRVTVL